MSDRKTAGGKGDKKRPQKVSEESMDENWERIFGSPSKQSLLRRGTSGNTNQEALVKYWQACEDEDK